VGDGAFFRGLWRSQWVLVRRTRRASVVERRPRRLGFPAGGGPWAGNGRALSDGSRFDAASAEVVLRKDARRGVPDWLAVSDLRRATPLCCARQPALPRAFAAVDAHRRDLAQPRHHDCDHDYRGSRQALEPKRTRKICRLAEPLVHGRICSVADGRSVADRPLIRETSKERRRLVPARMGRADQQNGVVGRGCLETLGFFA